VSNRRAQIAITAVAILLAGAHLIWPDVSIDAITVTLLIIAIVPWLGSLFSALEFPGGWKLEFRELEKVRLRAEAAGLLRPEYGRGGGGPGYLFQQVTSQDPNLALAGLRIEIERRLKDLAEARRLKVKRPGVSSLLTALQDKRVLTDDEVGALRDLVGTLNLAVHGARVDPWAFDWAMDVGPGLIGVLEEKLG
jgi:hypothetical protein